MTWICKPVAGHEKHGASVVYSEETGDTIALVYDGERHGEVVAAAPELLEALQNLEDAAALIEERWESGDLADAVRSLLVDRDSTRAAIAKAKGE
jgi:hypothetical protein